MDQTNNHKQEVLAYYQDTGLDYGEWSRQFNMHFGYYRFPMNPFRREPMLDEMNQRVLAELHLKDDDALVVDLGCGLAAPSRPVARRVPAKHVCGVTMSPWQVEQADKLYHAAGLQL